MDAFEQAHRDYERDGVAIIKNMFTYEEVCSIRRWATLALIYSSTDKPYRSGCRMQYTKTGSPALAFWPALTSGYLNSIRCSRRLGAVVKSFLGEDVKQLNNQVYYRWPGDDDAFAYHQDVMFRKAMAIDFDHSDYLQTAIIVDPMTEKNGGINFVLGSHRCDDLQLCEKESLRTETGAPVIFDNSDSEAPMPVKTMCAEPGDVMVWSVMAVHGSGKNLSHHSRMTYMNGFCRSKSCEAWPQYFDANGDAIHHPDVEDIPYA